MHARQGFQSAGLTNQVYRSWNNQNGLPQNTVYDIVQDDKGYLWGATEEGLFRFDGAEFYVIHAGNTPGISSSIFYDILSADGYIWASGRDFLLRIGNKVEKIINLPDAAYGGWIKCLAMDAQNRVWIGTSNGGLFYLQND
ncbi:MAG TPA: two-component regulator propeller domain-containing protein, partial [Chitinophagaceae bacterium]|nr:two-component regulator propeller domain-containing protein [Chitinophagaceae bacterium]